jgi:hypothetical protein
MRRVCCLVLALVAVTGGSCRRGTTRPALVVDSVPPRSPWGPNVGVVSEVYGKAEEATFNKRTKELVRSAFNRESAYRITPPFNVRHVFVASPGSGLTALKNRQTAFGLTYNGSSSGCYYAASEEVQTKITEAFTTPEPQTKVVLVHSDETGGCSEGDFIYLGDKPGDNNWVVMAHEFGHRLGLLDEIDGKDGEHPEKTLLEAANWNCSGCAGPRVWWHGELATPPSQGCDHYDLGVHRPSDQCRMGRNPENPFCLVCKLLLGRTLSHGSVVLPTCGADSPSIYMLNTKGVEDPGAQMRGNHYVRLLLNISRTGPVDNRIELLRSWDMEGRLQPAVVPGPRHLYAIRLNKEERWRFAEFFANDLFVRRSYSANGTHTTTEADSVSAVIRIPDLRLSELRGATDITVAVYRVRNPNVFLRSNIEPRELLGTSLAPLLNQLASLDAIRLEWQTQNLQGQLQ